MLSWRIEYYPFGTLRKEQGVLGSTHYVSTEGTKGVWGSTQLVPKEGTRGIKTSSIPVSLFTNM